MRQNYYYSMGLVGYEMWSIPNDSEHLMVLYVGTQPEQIARKYKIQTTPGGRMFVRPNGRRIYLDETLIA